MKAPAPTAEDQALFKQAMVDVKPLLSDRIHYEPPPPFAIPRQHHADEAAAMQDSLIAPISLEQLLESGTEPVWRRNGISIHVLRDLRRGRWAIQEALDLHGYTRLEAHEELSRFIQHCVLNQRRCVRIVHGRGLNSPGRKGILKDWVRHWLAKRQDVLAYCQAPLRDGGEGALWALLQTTTARPTK